MAERGDLGEDTMAGESKRGLGTAWTVFLIALGVMLVPLAMRWDQVFVPHAYTMAGEFGYWFGRLFVIPLLAVGIVLLARLISRLFWKKPASSTE